MKNFWNELPRPFFILAPMEEVTDVVFRHVVNAAAAPDIYFTEFTNTDSYFNEKGRHSTRGRLAFSEDEQPIVAQIWGSTPEHFAFMAGDMKEKGFAGIDINMGCPAKHAIKSGGGCALINTPELASEIIAATKSAGLPVSVKTRLGYTKPDELKDWIAHILRQDIVNLTIHLRTKKEMSKVPAHYELIPEIKKLRDEIAPQTLLTINGDIRDRAHGMELAEKYGVDGIMIGRGIFTNPFAFAMDDVSGPSPARVAVDGVTPPEPNEMSEGGVDRPTGPVDSDLREDSNGIFDDRSGRKQKLINLLNLHLDLFDKYSEELEPRKFEPLKRFFKIYIRDFAGASELRDKLMHTKSTDEVRQLISQ
jgi:tRNA-dihydrouridine synthase